MITAPALLKPYLDDWPLLFDRSELAGIQTFKVGHGEGIFYRLKSGEVFNQDGEQLPPDDGLYVPNEAH